ncbi:uncharacterized protein [Symphalangus syndactylus]|uniref:uncharacterized protein n=1 Tax=Symphalangus syndactylus TaxID=9590 RepID=UPI00300753BF
MHKSCPGKTNFVITLFPLPGKYECTHLRPATAPYASPLTRTITCPAHLPPRPHAAPSPPSPDTQLGLSRPTGGPGLAPTAREILRGKAAAPELPHLHRNRPIRDVTDSAFPVPVCSSAPPSATQPTNQLREPAEEVTPDSTSFPSHPRPWSLPKK